MTISVYLDFIQSTHLPLPYEWADFSYQLPVGLQITRVWSSLVSFSSITLSPFLFILRKCRAIIKSIKKIALANENGALLPATSLLPGQKSNTSRKLVPKFGPGWSVKKRVAPYTYRLGGQPQRYVTSGLREWFSAGSRVVGRTKCVVAIYVSSVLAHDGSPYQPATSPQQSNFVTAARTN